MNDRQLQVLADAEAMIRNELQYVQTGKHPGRMPMRDCVGQWKSLLRDIQKILWIKDSEG